MSSKTVFLHIGHGKTGSSALQACLASSHEALKQKGFLYPKHRGFERALKNYISSGNVSANSNSEWFEKQICSHIQESSDIHTYIFSSETMFSCPQQLLEGIGSSMAKWRPHVLLVVRNPLELVSSSYQQAVKRNGYRGSLSSFIRVHNFKVFHLHRSRAIVQGLNKLGIDFTLVNYSYYKTSVVERISSIMGISDIIQTKAGTPTIVNRSMTVSELLLLTALNSIFGKESASRISDSLVNLLPDIQADALQIADEDVCRIKDVNAGCLDLLNDYLCPESPLSFDYQYSTGWDFECAFNEDQIKVIKSQLRVLLEGDAKLIRD
jgi:hypothetical protein